MPTTATRLAGNTHTRARHNLLPADRSSHDVKAPSAVTHSGLSSPSRRRAHVLVEPEDDLRVVAILHPLQPSVRCRRVRLANNVGVAVTSEVHVDAAVAVLRHRIASGLRPRAVGEQWRGLGGPRDGVADGW